MRISDWSSDVCSSDLGARPQRRDPQPAHHRLAAWLDHPDFRRRRSRPPGGGGDPLPPGGHRPALADRSEEHTSELQSLMRISYAVFCLKKKKTNNNNKVTPLKR